MKKWRNSNNRAGKINLINAPAGATHFRLIHTLSVVSDFAYNAVTNSYDPIDTAQNEVSDVQFSGFLDLHFLFQFLQPENGFCFERFDMLLQRLVHGTSL